MGVFIAWGNLIVTVAITFISFIFNLKIYEFGAGEDYLVIRVYHFVFLNIGTGSLFFLLRAYFKGKGGSE